MRLGPRTREKQFPEKKTLRELSTGRLRSAFFMKAGVVTPLSHPPAGSTKSYLKSCFDKDDV